MRKHYLQQLGLPETAGKEDIVKAYRRLAKKYHPDISSEPDAQARFIAITEAYDFLISGKSISAFSFQKKHEPPKTKPKTKEEQQEDEREKIREMFRKQREKSRLRAEQYARMSFAEFRKTEYYRNTLRDLASLLLAPTTLAFGAGYFYVTWRLFTSELYFVSIILLAIPVSFICWVLFSRPE